MRLLPLRGVRYVPEEVGGLAAVTSPPLDGAVRRDEQAPAHPYSIVRLILPQAGTAEDRRQQASGTLRAWLAEGILASDAEPALYVYEQARGDVVQRGVIGALELSPPEEGIVLPHEDVIVHVLEERAALVRATAAQLEPLLLSYRGTVGRTGATSVVERATAGPPLLATTTEDGFHHRLWSLTDPADVSEVADHIAGHQALIADGHHRWATYLRLQREQAATPSHWDYGLVLLVDTALYPLQVKAIHRLLHRLPVSEALDAVADSFRVRRMDSSLARAMSALAKAASTGNAFLLAGDGSYYLLDSPDPALLARTMRQDRPADWRALDAAVLHETLLAQVWRIPDVADSIAYIHDAETAVAQAELHGATAVLMHPVREDVVHDLARRGITMPRKSTSFGPKPASGLILHRLEDLRPSPGQPG
ncbi:SpoOJ or ParA or ParB or repB family protein [Streptomyces sp. NRRL F-2295]|nr:SpoOJ or ParA or ParB or repB family protein [Streptomyces sp. NRRL F-2295]